MNTFAKIANTAAKESQAIRIASKERLRHHIAPCCPVRAQLTWILVLALSILVTMSSQLLASDGELDTTFGTGGRITPAFAGFARAVALQPDGKIVVAGWSGPTWAATLRLLRYNSDGSLDSSFGIQGKATTDFGATEQAFAVALQTDGKILVAGSSLVRYNSNGSLDTTFGIEGKISTQFSSAVVVQPDGKIVVGGGTGDPSRLDFGLARYNSDGSLDVGYGIGGKVTTDFSGRDDQVYALALQRDGKIVAAGRSNDFSAFTSGGMAFARYNTDGSLDPAFGIEGQVMDPDDYFPGAAYAVALQPDGKIVAAGGGVVVESGLRLARYNSDGSLDATFATAAKVSPFSGPSGPDAWSLALQSDGKIVIGTIPHVGVVSLARYNSDGSLDATFGMGGYVGDGEGATALAIQSDGKIIAVGSDFALARYNSDLPTLSFHPPFVVLGDSFTATFSGTSLNDETYFDVRFRPPGAGTDRVTLNWQRGISATHSAHTLTGTWTITGIHPHQNMDDHTPAFVPVSIDLKVAP